MWALLWLLPGILVLLLIWLLVAPIQLRIDTRRELVEARIRGIVRFWLDTGEGNWKVKARVFAFPIRLSGRKKKRPARKQKKRKTKKRKQRMSFRLALRYMRLLGKTFRLKRCVLEIDTEDYPLNARLFMYKPPLESLGVDLDVNFEGRNEVDLVLENRAYRIIWSLIRMRITN